MEGKSRLARMSIAMKALLGLGKFIDKDKQPKSINFVELLKSIFMKHDFSAMGRFHMKSLFIGMMHFQDEYTYDVHRVEKCSVHYAMPDGEVLPFCTFNVFPEIYRDKIQKQYSTPANEWQKNHPGWTYSKDKYIRDVKKLEASRMYKKTYGNLKDYFALPINGGKPVANFTTEKPEGKSSGGK